MRRTSLFAAGFAILVSACGGADSLTTTTAEPDGSANPSTTIAAATATTQAKAAIATTTAEPGVTFASLEPRQQEIVNLICLAATDPSQDRSLGEHTILSVIVGESGLPALAEAWEELGQETTAEMWDMRLEAAAPICADIAWSPMAPATTTTLAAATASVVIQIGDLTVAGDTEGCPSTEILAGQYWVGPNRDTWTDSAGESWTVSLSVDASDGDLKWSFSADGSQRWVSYHVNQSSFTPDVTADSAYFETIFNDQIASVSGGKPDTAGTVTISCP